MVSCSFSMLVSNTSPHEAVGHLALLESFEGDNTEITSFSWGVAGKSDWFSFSKVLRSIRLSIPYPSSLRSVWYH